MSWRFYEPSVCRNYTYDNMTFTLGEILITAVVELYVTVQVSLLLTVYSYLPTIFPFYTGCLLSI